ncbi:hypothetical protein GCM10009006_35820 [Haloarcula argentinensis]|uniref:Uncharacterized protein n=1 Tax=Haloarcula argentinensis TaxID=43776 RepID=A0A830FRN0_HALAR|nr:hypothetical protein GCM10009006_35820 [Haloarcula argentinensis]
MCSEPLRVKDVVPHTIVSQLDNVGGTDILLVGLLGQEEHREAALVGCLVGHHLESHELMLQYMDG